MSVGRDRPGQVKRSKRGPRRVLFTAGLHDYGAGSLARTGGQEAYEDVDLLAARLTVFDGFLDDRSARGKVFTARLTRVL